MKKITPHLWYDTEAVEAANLYAAALPDSKVTNVNTIHDTPSGDTDIVSFELCCQPFMSISAGPLFKFTPAVSFLISCETFGANSPKAARRLCRSTPTRSANATDGPRTGSDSRGR